MKIVRKSGLEWKDRKNFDNWPSRIATYYENPTLDLAIRLVDYPVGSTEPRHVHPGRHAATVLRGKALVDGLTLGPLDVVLGPSNEPHGPLHYPEGCNLLSAFQGSHFHNEVQELSGKKEYRLIQQAELPWTRGPGQGETKTLVDHGLGRLLVEVLRFPAGARHTPTFLGALVVEGSPQVRGETLGEWDLVYADDGDARDEMSFPEGATLLAMTMRAETQRPRN